MSLYNNRTYASLLSIPSKRFASQDTYQAASAVSGEIKAFQAIHLICCYTRKIAG